VGILLKPSPGKERQKKSGRKRAAEKGRFTALN
jgi:hypothetical protein